MEVIVKGQPSIEIGFETKVIQVGGFGDIDSSLSTESENPVQNKVVTEKLTELSQEKEDKTNKVTSLTEESTDEQYPSAKAVYALSERISENEILIEDLQNTKIDKEADDYYPQLAVGLADNLAGVDVVDSEVNFRRSGGGAISDGVARIESIKGNSVVWNQLYSDTQFENGIGNWKSYGSATLGLDADGSLLVTATNTTARAIYNSRYEVPANHKILTIVDFKPNNIGNGQFLFYMKGSSTTETLRTYKYTKTERQIAYTIIEHDVKTYIAYYPIHNGEVGDTANVYSVVAFDLTQMFGAGNEPTTIEEFYARIPMGVDLNAYNEGEVIHMDVQSVESQGVNAWDEEWELGSFNVTNGANLPTNDAIRNKNYIKVLPKQGYYFKTPTNYKFVFYDEQKNYISGDGKSTNQVITTPSNCHYLRFSVGVSVSPITTYNNDICINISDTSINGKYFPYIKRVEDLSVIRKYFPQGMKSAGTAHDEIRYNKATQKWEKVVRIGEVDLGTLDWTQDANNYRFYTKGLINFIKKPDSWGRNLLCAKYDSIMWDSTLDKFVTVLDNGSIFVKDSSYTDAASFKAAMQGVILYYELAEPIVTELDAEDQFRDLDYQVWNCGTEKAIAEGKSAPLAADITYGFNAIGKIKELESLVAQLRAKVGI